MINKKIRKTHQGYIVTSLGKSVHRLLIEEKIGRKLTPSDMVHHIDYVRDNNDIDNLVLCNSKEHGQIESSLNKILMDMFRKKLKRGKIYFDRTNKKYRISRRFNGRNK